jgi:hypothetical protein
MSLPGILQQLNNCNPQVNAFANNFMNAMMAIQNPQEYIQNMAAQNSPLLQEAINCIKQNGGDGQKAFYQYASDHGIDPQMLANLMTGRR